MSQIKKLVIFSFGSCYDASSWSNIPYLMRLHLEKKGITVVCKNIMPNRIYRKIINILIKADNFYGAIRTPFTKFITEFKIKKFLNKHKDADFCIFLNFDYYNKFNDIPSLNFSDWTYDIYLKRENWEATNRDRQFILRQKEVIENSNIVIPLFEESYKKMVANYPRANIKNIPQNVVNLLDYDETLQEKEIIEQKFNSDFILFIGRNQYRESLERLLEIIELKKSKIKLHVIGMEGQNTDSVTYHGWLRKDSKEDNQIYYRLLRNAKLCVNTTPKWSGYSSLIEAMYYYTPVVVYPFEQFKNEFGPNINFGFYSDGTLNNLNEKIDLILDKGFIEYSEMAKNAHNIVKDYTWENYIEKIIYLMEKHLL